MSCTHFDLYVFRLAYTRYSLSERTVILVASHHEISLYTTEMLRNDESRRLASLILSLLFTSALIMSVYEFKSTNYEDGIVSLLIGLVGLWSIGFHRDLTKFLYQGTRFLLRKVRKRQSS